MKRLVLTLTAAAALTLAGGSAAQAAPTCYTIPVPAVPAVYDTVVTPAVTVTEYEFIHAQDGNGHGNGNGPASRWEANPNWNAESNPQSIGWTATGNTRLTVIETEKTTVTLVTPEIPATTVEQCLDLPDGVSPVQPGDPNPAPPAPAPAPAAEAPAPAEVPALAQEAATPAVEALLPQLAPAPVAQPEAVAAAAPLPEELAYTGAADWVLPAGGGLVGLGVLLLGGSYALRRFV